MKLKNVLIVVKDIEKSKVFYKDLFGLQEIQNNEGNVILTEGLVLQDAAVWKDFLKKEIMAYNHASELYFEERDMKSFINKLDHYKEPIQYISQLAEDSWGQKSVRLYDPDGNMIEVRSPMQIINK